MELIGDLATVLTWLLSDCVFPIFLCAHFSDFCTKTAEVLSGTVLGSALCSNIE
jgi:hypothetical protein